MHGTKGDQVFFQVKHACQSTKDAAVGSKAHEAHFGVMSA